MVKIEGGKMINEGVRIGVKCALKLALAIGKNKSDTLKKAYIFINETLRYDKKSREWAMAEIENKGVEGAFKVINVDCEEIEKYKHHMLFGWIFDFVKNMTFRAYFTYQEKGDNAYKRALEYANKKVEQWGAVFSIVEADRKEIYEYVKSALIDVDSIFDGYKASDIERIYRVLSVINEEAGQKVEIEDIENIQLEQYYFDIEFSDGSEWRVFYSDSDMEQWVKEHLLEYYNDVCGSECSHILNWVDWDRAYNDIRAGGDDYNMAFGYDGIAYETEEGEVIGRIN